jgi:hypothetical protein
LWLFCRIISRDNGSEALLAFTKSVFSRLERRKKYRKNLLTSCSKSINLLILLAREYTPCKSSLNYRELKFE